MPALDPNDNGFSSRKFWLVVGAILVLAGVGILSGYKSATRDWTPIQTIYVVLTGSVLGLVGLYYGVNGAVKYMSTKQDSGGDKP